MAAIDPVRIDGLKDFSRQLRQLDAAAPKGLRLAHNEAAALVAAAAVVKIRRRSGAAARSVKARSTRTQARVTGGGPKVRYYPWLDFGGRVGPRRSVARPFIKAGRYIYPAWTNNREEVTARLMAALVQVARDAGWEVDGS